MLTGQELEAAVEHITDRLDEINSLYIKKIAAQILKIGELNTKSINQLVAMTEMGASIAEINTALQEATALNVRELFEIYQTALTAGYTDPRFKPFLQETPLTPVDKTRLTFFTQQVSVQTAKSLINLSNTTLVDEPYRRAIDTAIMATSTGLTDYKSATRDVIRQIGTNGLQVFYPSGYHRRLDTAVRQNIIDGVNQINQHASLAMGEALGFDAVELSAHAHSAPDHEPVQGRVFLKAEFEKMQAGEDFRDVDGRYYEGFDRPIGEWNCMHIAMGFSTQYSKRRYSETQLNKWAEENRAGCEINGKHYTTYKARQLMRQLETKVRRAKDVANAARYAEDMELRRDCQATINSLTQRYYAVAQASGIKPRSARLSVEGFMPVKI